MESLPNEYLSVPNYFYSQISGTDLENIFRLAKKVISKADVVCYLEDSDEYYTPDLYVNQFLVMYSLENKKQSALGRFDGTNIVNLHYR